MFRNDGGQTPRAKVCVSDCLTPGSTEVEVSVDAVVTGGADATSCTTGTGDFKSLAL